jgi:hypothetical protein
MLKYAYLLLPALEDSQLIRLVLHQPRLRHT